MKRIKTEDAVNEYLEYVKLKRKYFSILWG